MGESVAQLRYIVGKWCTDPAMHGESEVIIMMRNGMNGGGKIVPRRSVASFDVRAAFLLCFLKRDDGAENRYRQDHDDGSENRYRQSAFRCQS
jgi:hypothetical protein